MSDDLRRHLVRCYGDDRCTCPHKILPLGILYGISFGKGWVRLYDVKGCPHHDQNRAGTLRAAAQLPAAPVSPPKTR